MIRIGVPQGKFNFAFLASSVACSRAAVSVSAKPRAITSRPSMTTSHCHLLGSAGADIVMGSVAQRCSIQLSECPRPSSDLPRVDCPTRRYAATPPCSLACLSSASNASITSSKRTGRFPPGGRRKAETASIAHASEAHEARIARFSFSVRSGSLNACAGRKSVSRSQASSRPLFLVQECGLAVHRLSSASFDLNCSWPGLLDLRQR